MGVMYVSDAYVLYAVGCPHIPMTTHYFVNAPKSGLCSYLHYTGINAPVK